MSYTNVYPSRINWENEPSIASPINATNLNKMDYALYEIDGTLDTWDVTKANQSDLLLSVKSIDYDTETGVFLFTWQNGTTKTVDLNIEKIPVSFSMDANGVITMTTDDGTTYTADVGSLIKTYTFNDSSEIDFTTTTDSSGNKVITASIVAGSIDGTKLVPNYLADCQAAKNGAEGAETRAGNSANTALSKSYDSEAWAVGTRAGSPVPSTDPAYQNNSKYWAQHGSNSFEGLTDVAITSPSNGQVPVYDNTTQKWKNGNVATSIDSLTDVDITNVQNGEILVYDTLEGKWVNDSAPGGGSLANLSDVSVSSATEGNTIIYDDLTNKWLAGNQSLSKLSDTNVSNPASGHFLKYNGSYWVNSQLPTATKNNYGTVIIGNGLSSGTFVRTVYDGTVEVSQAAQSATYRVVFDDYLDDAPYVRIRSNKNGQNDFIILSATISCKYPSSQDTSVTLTGGRGDEVWSGRIASGLSRWNWVEVTVYTTGTFTTEFPLCIELYTSNTEFTEGLSTIDHWTTPASCAIGDTTCTIQDAALTSTSIVEPYAETSSGTLLTCTSIVVGNGQAVLTFPALTEAADIRLKVTNL